MRRSLTLLIVMALVGAPGSSLACELWCSTPTAAHHHDAVGCHEGAPMTGGAQQVYAVGDCHDTAAISAFLIEGRKTETAPSEPLPATLEALAVTQSAGSNPAIWWSAFQTKPPRGPSFHAVLRI